MAKNRIQRERNTIYYRSDFHFPTGHLVRKIQNRPSETIHLRVCLVLYNYAPMGIRIPVLALKGPRPSPLDDGGELTTSILPDVRDSVKSI